jgi:hypothetical protein
MSNIGKKNVYTCLKCNRSIITVDVDDGTTPFMLDCRATPGCDGVMQSAFYDVPVGLPPDFEWFKPKSLKDYSPEMKEHIQKGGLDLRPVQPEAQPRRKKKNFKRLPCIGGCGTEVLTYHGKASECRKCRRKRLHAGARRNYKLAQAKRVAERRPSWPWAKKA